MIILTIKKNKENPNKKLQSKMKPIIFHTRKLFTKLLI